MKKNGSSSVILDRFGKPYHKPTKAIKRANPNGSMLDSRYWGDRFGYGYYQGAHPGLQRGVITGHSPQDFSTEAIYAREFLAYFARDLRRNCAEVKGIIEKIIDFVVGVQMDAQSCSEKGKEEYNDYFREWSHKALTNGANFGEVQRICLRNLIIDGDIGVLKTRIRGRPYLQLFPIHRIGNVFSRNKPKSGEFGGVEFNNDTGEITRYWIRKGQYAMISELKESIKDVPVYPHQFSLIYSNDFCDQYRGISHLASSINDAIDFSNVMEAMKKGMVFRELISMIITRQGGVIDPDEDESAPLIDPEEETGVTRAVYSGRDNVLDFRHLAQHDELLKVMGAGTAPVMKVGEDIKDMSSNRPSEQVLAAYDKMVGRLCQSLGVSYELVIDPGKIHGTATRAVLRVSEGAFNRYATTINDRLNKFVWNFVISHGMIRKEIPMYPDWDKVIFRSPKSPTVDIARDTKAELAQLSAGVKNMSDVLGDEGKDFFEHIDRGICEREYMLKKAQDVARKYGMELQEAIAFLYGKDVAEAGVSTTEREESQVRRS